MTSRRGRDVRRATGLLRRFPARGMLRGLVVAGLAGAAWCLGAASAHAAVLDDSSAYDLAPMTTSSLGEAAKSVQAANPTQSNQLDQYASPLLDVAPVEGASGTGAGSSPSSVRNGGSEHGGTRVPTDTVARGTEEKGKSSRDTRSIDRTSPTSTEGAVQTSDAPLELVGDTVEPFGLRRVVAAPAAPLDPYLGLVRPVSEPLASVARPVVDPLAETVNSGGMGAVTQPVAGVLHEVTAPVAMVVSPMSASLAQVAPIVPALPGNALGTFVSRLDGTLIGPDSGAANRPRVTPAQALLHAAGYSAEYRPGVERSISSHDAAVISSSVTGHAAPFAPLPSQYPMGPDLGHITGGALSGGAGVTLHDGGSATAHQNLTAGDPRVSRVAPATANAGLPSERISDPVVSPD
ncbi:hypothetical protein [Phytomonospora endophytica]|uniref:Uncharacterized protein n=1 Tax=Phytomonospora endophytica TaxID=714109 RepID=A0A841G2N9_9ACTN|nr:hypothetical protein [Phytomonospora endophytica]MBB6038400.1 hypothetical protein [Phytomonospora endophytica]